MSKDNLIQRLQRGGAAGFINPGVDTTAIYANTLGELFNYMSQKESQNFQSEQMRQQQIFQERESEKNRQFNREQMESREDRDDLNLMMKINPRFAISYIENHPEQFDFDVSSLSSRINEADTHIENYKRLLGEDKTNYTQSLDSINNALSIFSLSPSLFEKDINVWTKRRDQLVNNIANSMVAESMITELGQYVTPEQQEKYQNLLNNAKQSGNPGSIVPLLNTYLSTSISHDQKLNEAGQKQLMEIQLQKQKAKINLVTDVIQKSIDPDNPSLDEDGNPITAEESIKMGLKVLDEMFPESVKKKIGGDDVDDVDGDDGDGSDIDKINAEVSKRLGMDELNLPGHQNKVFIPGTKLILKRGGTEYVSLGRGTKRGATTIRIKNVQTGREKSILQSNLDRYIIQ